MAGDLYGSNGEIQEAVRSSWETVGLSPMEKVDRTNDTVGYLNDGDAPNNTNTVTASRHTEENVTANRYTEESDRYTSTG